jgi:hypothetical protein
VLQTSVREAEKSAIIMPLCSMRFITCGMATSVRARCYPQFAIVRTVPDWSTKALRECQQADIALSGNLEA